MKDEDAQEIIGCYLYEMCGGTLWRIDGLDLADSKVYCHGADGETLERSSGNWTLSGDELVELCKSGDAAIYHPLYLRGLRDGLSGVRVGQHASSKPVGDGGMMPLSSLVQ